jgi:hypothetical protein
MLHLILYSVYYVTLTINYTLFVIRHPDDGHRSDRNILVKNFNI